MTNEEKQNNIVEEYNRKTHSSGYQSELYESLQEYGEWVRQQTLEEAIAESKDLPRKTINGFWYVELGSVEHILQALKDRSK